MIRTVECRLYPNNNQIKTLNNWLEEARHTFNKALEQRKKAYERRKQSISYNEQSQLLTKQRYYNYRVWNYALGKI